MRHVPPLCTFVRTYVSSSARAFYSRMGVECVFLTGLKGVKHHFVDVHNIMSFDCL